MKWVERVGIGMGGEAHVKNVLVLSRISGKKEGATENQGRSVVIRTIGRFMNDENSDPHRRG